eukprot:5223162-Amphidinium_carterae.1
MAWSLEELLLWAEVKVLRADLRLYPPILYTLLQARSASPFPPTVLATCCGAPKRKDYHCSLSRGLATASFFGPSIAGGTCSYQVLAHYAVGAMGMLNLTRRQDSLRNRIYVASIEGVRLTHTHDTPRPFAATELEAKGEHLQECE